MNKSAWWQRILVLAAAVSMPLTAMAFTPPSEEQRTTAIGNLNGLSKLEWKAYSDSTDYLVVASPGPDDWLANHYEKGQSFDQFLLSKPSKPNAQRDTIYLAPLGEFSAQCSPSLAELRQFTELFFQLKVKILPPIDIADAKITARINEQTAKRQLLTRDILSFLKSRLPQDAFAMVGITMNDLYPDPDWNFVFGEALPEYRVGVYSFARYDPAFFGEERTQDFKLNMRRRSMKVLAHETLHLFGVDHCIFYDCLMNGSNNQEESDAQPIEVCPIDLRKLHYSVGFDILNRYEGLKNFYHTVGLNSESTWLSKHIEHLKSATQF